MPMPAIKTVTGTGTTIWTPDWMQTPFVVGIAAIFSGAPGTASVDASFDDPNVIATTAQTWWPIIALTSANATANYTTPVQALRVNMQTAVSTSVVTVTFVQAMYPR